MVVGCIVAILGGVLLGSASLLASVITASCASVSAPSVRVGMRPIAFAMGSA